jgi:hypothetical protein
MFAAQNNSPFSFIIKIKDMIDRIGERGRQMIIKGAITEWFFPIGNI